jgi:hypothetical protein
VVGGLVASAWIMLAYLAQSLWPGSEPLSSPLGPELWTRLAFPAAACLLLVALAVNFSGLAPDQGIKFPKNITLPLVHVALCAVLTRLALTTRGPFEVVPAPLAPAIIWTDPARLIGATLVAIALLTVNLRRESPKR